MVVDEDPKMDTTLVDMSGVAVFGVLNGMPVVLVLRDIREVYCTSLILLGHHQHRLYLLCQNVFPDSSFL